MGRIEEIESLEDNIDEPERLKEAGNDAFKKGNYDAALECYTKAIKKTKDSFEKQKAVYYKNRAAFHTWTKDVLIKVRININRRLQQRLIRIKGRHIEKNKF